MLLMVPFGPRVRPRLCAFAKADLAECVVLVESIDGVRSATSEEACLRPRTVPVFVLPAWLFPATILNAQFVSDTDDDRREEPSVVCS
jgi:hypothetical protein